MNIVKIITTLEYDDRSEVIPVDRPTVLYAENDSKAMLSSDLSLSKVAIKNIESPMTSRESEIIEKALLTEACEISLL